MALPVGPALPVFSTSHQNGSTEWALKALGALCSFARLSVGTESHVGGVIDRKRPDRLKSGQKESAQWRHRGT
jgi:hypothetical protein